MTIEDVVVEGIGSATSSVTSVLTTALPSIFVIFGGLSALGLAIFYFRKLVARRKA